MKVTQTVLALDAGEAAEITYYTGDSLPEAMSSLVMAAADAASPTISYIVKSVRIEF